MDKLLQNKDESDNDDMSFPTCQSHNLCDLYLIYYYNSNV